VVVLKLTVARPGRCDQIFLNGRHDQLAVAVSSIAVRFGVRRLVAACLYRVLCVSRSERRSTKSHEAAEQKPLLLQMRLAIVYFQEPQSLKWGQQDAHRNG